MSVDGINIYTKANVTNASEQVGRNYQSAKRSSRYAEWTQCHLGQDAVHINRTNPNKSKKNQLKYFTSADMNSAYK